MSTDSTPVQFPLPLEGSTVEIPLTKGYVTVVDAIDGDLIAINWFVKRSNGDNYYARARVARRNNTPLHRVVMSRILGRELTSNEFVDHIDGDSLNNQRSNLRLATAAENQWNSGLSKANTSGFKGVWKTSSGRWRASLYYHRNAIWLGTFDSPEEAYQAYCEAALKYHGEFARFE